MTDAVRDVEHAAVDELLPWYVNGTLGSGELARVRRHLQVCGACRESVSLLSRVDEVVNRPAATPIMPPPRPEALLSRIDRAGSAGFRQWKSPALAAAVSLVIATAAFLLAPPGREAGVPAPPAYETVTSDPKQSTMEYVMNVVFEPGVAPEDRQRVLRDLQASDIRSDESGGGYQVNVTLDAVSLDELNRFTMAVEARSEVKSARIIALQLPMQREAGKDDR